MIGKSSSVFQFEAGSARLYYMRLISAAFVLITGILLLPQTRAYFVAKQKEAEIVYTNLGTAALRMVDPDRRRGIAIEGAWSISR